MAKKKSNTGMIIAIIVSVIVVGIVVWGFLTKWKFIDDGKSTEKAKAKKEVQKKIDAIINTPTDTKVVEVTPKMEEKLKEIEKKDEEKIKSMSEEDIKNKMNEIKKISEKQLSSFRIIEHMTDEETDGSSTPKTCEFTDEEIESVITKALNLIKFIKPNLDVTSAIPKIVNYYKALCQAEVLGLTLNKSVACQVMLGNKFNPHALGLYSALDLIKPPEGDTAGMLYKYRYLLFSPEDKQPVSWSVNVPYIIKDDITSDYSIKISKGESKEIRMLYKFYRYLKACPPVKKIDSDCVNPDIGADAWGFTCKDKETYGWLCDYNTEHSCQCCACDKSKCGESDTSGTASVAQDVAQAL